MRRSINGSLTNPDEASVVRKAPEARQYHPRSEKELWILVRNKIWALVHTGEGITDLLELPDDQFIPEQNPTISPVASQIRATPSPSIPGLVRILSHTAAEYQLLPIAARPQGRAGHFIIDNPNKSGFTNFFPSSNFRKFSTTKMFPPAITNLR